jgi:Glycosyl transferase family 2.
MRLLSICVPNYNRIEKLKRLLYKAIDQIQREHLESIVSICVSDDYSEINPVDEIRIIQKEHPNVNIRFRRNNRNEGMDFNFISSVIMADTKYCWIVGNDDLFENNGIRDAVELLRTYLDVDFIVSPFDTVDDTGRYMGTVWPLLNKEEILYTLTDSSRICEFLLTVAHNSGVFGFLSNVIVKRDNWVTRKNRFSEQIGSIFIQMYINIDTMLCGCRYLFTDRKLIVNQSDSITNLGVDRMSKILFGLDDVVEYFFLGEVKKHFKRILTDAYIVGELWELPDESEVKGRLIAIRSEKNEIYRRYYISGAHLAQKLRQREVIIFGAGEYGVRTYKKAVDAGARVIGYADSSKEKEGIVIDKYMIMSPEKMISEYMDSTAIILVANHHCLPEMIDYLISNNVGRIGVLV